MTADSVAVWYWRSYSLHFDLFDDEEEAAEQAVWMEDAGEAAIQGVQFADGRTFTRNNWPAYQVAYQRERDAKKAEAAAAGPPPCRRGHIVSPWGGGATAVWDGDALPEWLGKVVEDDHF